MFKGIGLNYENILSIKEGQREQQTGQVSATPFFAHLLVQYALLLANKTYAAHCFHFKTPPSKTLNYIFDSWSAQSATEQATEKRVLI